MELRSPRPTGTSGTTGMAESLQHQAAMRVQARLDAEEAAKRHVAGVQRLKTVLAFLFVAVVAGVGYWAWTCGRFDEWFGKTPSVASLSPTERATGTAAVTPAGTPPAAGGAKIRTVAAPKAQETIATVEENARAFAETEAEFAGATVDYWKNAVPEDRAKKGKAALLFTALVPDGKGGHRLLTIQMGGKKGFVAGELSASRGLIELSRTDFDGLIAGTPYLVLREKRAYFCSPGRGSLLKGVLPLPAKGAGFNPAKAEFGALYDRLAAVKTKKPTFRYEVRLDFPHLKKSFPVATVAFGEEVPHAAFERVAREQVDDADTVRILLSTGKVSVKAL